MKNVQKKKQKSSALSVPLLKKVVKAVAIEVAVEPTCFNDLRCSNGTKKVLGGEVNEAESRQRSSVLKSIITTCLKLASSKVR